jgi:uncharacterized protein YukE
MGNQFRVDPASLRAAGPRFTAESDALSHALGQLGSALSGLSGMCGDDEQGHAFAAKYDPQAAELQRVIREMVDGLSRIGSAFPTMADNYEGADHASQVRKGG